MLALRNSEYSAVVVFGVRRNELAAHRPNARNWSFKLGLAVSPRSLCSLCNLNFLDVMIDRQAECWGHCALTDRLVLCRAGPKSWKFFLYPSCTPESEKIDPSRR